MHRDDEQLGAAFSYIGPGAADADGPSITVVLGMAGKALGALDNREPIPEYGNRPVPICEDLFILFAASNYLGQRL
jgi:hypothetical protein